jgi:hypothetical protein
MQRPFFATLIVLALLARAGLARGQEARGAAEAPPSPSPTDTVYLKNGETLRGTVVEARFNDHATVRLPDGRSVRIEWYRIARIEVGSSPLSAQGRDDEQPIHLSLPGNTSRYTMQDASGRSISESEFRRLYRSRLGTPDLDVEAERHIADENRSMVRIAAITSPSALAIGAGLLALTVYCVRTPGDDHAPCGFAAAFGGTAAGIGAYSLVFLGCEIFAGRACLAMTGGAGPLDVGAMSRYLHDYDNVRRSAPGAPPTDSASPAQVGPSAASASPYPIGDWRD